MRRPYRPPSAVLRSLRRGAVLLGASPLLLAGLFPVDEGGLERWCWSGAWRFPVGDPADHARAGPEGDPGYRANRNVTRGVHDGVDLSNRQARGIVRAAANGLVVSAGRTSNDGYGEHVVLAHRECDGGIVYSVYAHLTAGSIRVVAGQAVAAGTPLGLVGATGRASAPHLHFEVRRAAEPEARWENAPVRDPLAYVRERLAGALADTSWSGPYRAWAEEAGLVPPAGADDRLTRAAWWRMLAASVRHPGARIDGDPEALRALLSSCGLVPRGAAEETPSWTEMADDLERAGDRGLRLPAAPLPRERRAQDARLELGIDRPRQVARLDRVGVVPRVATACLVLAEAAGERAETAAARREPER